MSFMEDPDNPNHGLPPAPPSPEEEWSGLDGNVGILYVVVLSY